MAPIITIPHLSQWDGQADATMLLLWMCVGQLLILLPLSSCCTVGIFSYSQFNNSVKCHMQ